MGDKSNLRCVLDGLAIFAKHGGTDVCAQHDKLFAGPNVDAELSAEELAQLEADGWFEDEDSWAIYNMTTDANRNNAEQWHIPPVEASKQPVMAMSVIDLKPLIMWWQAQEQRLRDQLAVERGATSSAREALAACEERLRASEAARALANGDAVEARQALTTERVSVAHWTRKAKEFFQERDALQSKLDETATAATVAVARPEPGSVEAVKEAVRLLTGDEPRVCCAPPDCGDIKPWWATSPLGSVAANAARSSLLAYLEDLQPAATVAPVVRAEFERVEELGDSARGAYGFGSTGR